jgi:flagellar basal body-associated protein FliL
MDNEQRLSDLEERMTSHEKKWKKVKNILIVILVIWLILFVIGLTQYLIA